MSSRQGGNSGGYGQQQGGYAAPAPQANYQASAPQAPAPAPVAAPPAADVYDEDIPF